jgi:molecular chaperone GrpE
MSKKADKAELQAALEDIEKLTAERDEFLSKYQRAHADMVNMRRRATEDNEDRVRRRMQPLLEEMLLVLDNLEMALMCPTESPDAKNLAIGVEMTKNLLLSALGVEDVQRIDATGPLNPRLHQAIAVVEDTDVPAGHIVNCTRAGYTWRDFVLRSPQVRVSPGDAQLPEAEQPEEPAPVEPEPTDSNDPTNETAEA